MNPVSKAGNPTRIFPHAQMEASAGSSPEHSILHDERSCLKQALCLSDSGDGAHYVNRYCSF